MTSRAVCNVVNIFDANIPLEAARVAVVAATVAVVGSCIVIAVVLLAVAPTAVVNSTAILYTAVATDDVSVVLGVVVLRVKFGSGANGYLGHGLSIGGPSIESNT